MFTRPKTNISSLKNDAWKIISPIEVVPFQGDMFSLQDSHVPFMSQGTGWWLMLMVDLWKSLATIFWRVIFI